jgi:hypothetical protein
MVGFLVSTISDDYKKLAAKKVQELPPIFFFF